MLTLSASSISGYKPQNWYGIINIILPLSLSIRPPKATSFKTLTFLTFLVILKFDIEISSFFSSCVITPSFYFIFLRDPLLRFRKVLIFELYSFSFKTFEYNKVLGSELF